MIQSIGESKAFHSAILKRKIGIQEAISLYSFLQNVDFKHSLDAEIDLEEEEIKRFKD